MKIINLDNYTKSYNNFTYLLTLQLILMHSGVIINLTYELMLLILIINQ